MLRKITAVPVPISLVTTCRCSIRHLQSVPIFPYPTTAKDYCSLQKPLPIMELHVHLQNIPLIIHCKTVFLKS